MRASKRLRPRLPARERGAALVIGLILLMVLTLLAVTGMNTASTELIMAGNEQYRQNAFQAAETGIENAVAVLPTVPQSTIPTVVPNTTTAGTTYAQYTTSTLYEGDDLNVPGYSAGKYVGLHYEITSTGSTTVRNASAVHRQGAFVVQGTGGGGSFAPLPGAGP